jgi:hypothetical protein
MSAGDRRKGSDMDRLKRPSRAIGFGCIAIGAALALISGLAETVGIGGGTFGPKQIAGVAVGCVIALAGVTIVVGPSSRPPNTP